MPSTTFPPGFRPVGAFEASDPTARRALFRASSNTPVRHAGQIGCFDPSGADLSVLNSGRAPLLLDHSRSIRDVIGVIESAWQEGSAILAIARFGEGPDAALAWANVSAGVWVNCSLGNQVLHCSRAGDGPVMIEQWTPTELSIVPQGWVHDAAVLPMWDLAELQRQSVARREEARRKEEAQRWRMQIEGNDARRQQLHLIAAAIAPDLGLEEAEVKRAMDGFLAAVAVGEGHA